MTNKKQTDELSKDDLDDVVGGWIPVLSAKGEGEADGDAFQKIEVTSQAVGKGPMRDGYYDGAGNHLRGKGPVPGSK